MVLALFLGLYVGTSVFGSYYDATSSSTAPNVPVVIPAALSVRSEILFATLDISAFESSPAFELAFRTNFSVAVAAQAGVSPSQVNIVSITAGSVKVLSVVYFSSTGSIITCNTIHNIRWYYLTQNILHIMAGYMNEKRIHC